MKPVSILDLLKFGNSGKFQVNLNNTIHFTDQNEKHCSQKHYNILLKTQALSR